MKNCILINAFPNNNFKISLLRELIANLKSCNLPIIVCSGCTPPEDIIFSVDYVVVNKEKIIKPALYQKQKFLEGKGYVSALYTDQSVIFHDNVDLTITKNIKLLFNLAKFFGFENVMYTEDDNLFTNSDDYQKKHLDILNNKNFKMCATISSFGEVGFGLHTTHFFSNVDFLLENFKLPDSLEDLYNPNISDKFQTWCSYETSAYKCFEPHLDKIHKVDYNDYFKNVNFQKNFVRDNSLEYIAKQRTRFIKLKTGMIHGQIFNSSTNLKLKIKITTKNSSYEIDNLNPQCWHLTGQIEFGDWLIVEYFDKTNNNSTVNKIIYDSEDKILSLQMY